MNSILAVILACVMLLVILGGSNIAGQIPRASSGKSAPAGSAQPPMIGKP